jgi:hypothetical protein
MTPVTVFDQRKAKELRNGKKLQMQIARKVEKER